MKILTVKKGTYAFIKNIKNKKVWEYFVTTKENSFSESDVYAYGFKINTFITFKRGNWLLAVQADDIEEENIPGDINEYWWTSRII